MKRALGTAVDGVLAALVATVVATVGLYAFSLVEWPAFNSSNVTRALTTLGQVVCAALLGAAIVLYRRGTRAWLARGLTWVGLSGFVTVTLGMPLAATKLYLFGISVDQEFRTEYLTRLTDSAALRDMTYADIPPFYPAGWFWIGGRVGNLLGMDGWEVFKPFAIGFLAVTAVVAYTLWRQLVRADLAVAVSAVTTALVVAYASPEAYSAVIALLIAPAFLLAWGALNRPVTAGFVGIDGPRHPIDGNSGPSMPTKAGKNWGWGAVVGTGLFLGLAATFYTLYLGMAAFAVVLMAIVSAFLGIRAEKTWRAAIPVVVRLAVIAAISGLVALTVWLPYLIDALTGTPATSGTALHYLPETGATLPFPMFEFSLLGALTMIGTLWLAVRTATSRRAQALTIGVVAVYLWTLLSMAATVAGTTLLSFRLEAVLIVLLGAAGVFGFIEGSKAIYQAINEPVRFKAAAVVVAAVGALAFAQNIPQVLQTEITVAYQDTDGDGVRADKRPPSAVSYYGDVDKAIGEQLGKPRDETIVLTADTSFLSYYPYFGFQGLTSHYANPLAQFDQRAAAIEDWAELGSPDELVAAMDSSEWTAPDAFLFRRGADGYTLRLAEDVYPNDPNVRRYTVTFDESLFEDSRFTVTDIGPFALVTRVS
ncbi:galactan 5-O-arabinofuranosyltransferase [Rhodococcus sp. BP-252]|uniref:galactan 5-O-arabinofuranosyltransferase n=1 Tax=unclassified Rhodococcus (in: high G+C Gram-positive bacteria) TaxID=192944 RepID=UPI001C9A7FDC|nr:MULTISPECIES: galactan 5-O-arabinofuranosyltransferase [unclassified Rhodococcus (in: high G+C Gram-positive bacteria)]MBY6410626.1 galactan 5-O-arabinofuranosyltransferase [Rhodococcus sp. BP-320]MBY6415549.1 galactan 5-O-arabinofuranosyltransferase [Rhodococcus sp. BP-321]MBY6424410.1 galactan 5-O-arabinofuranosyltransferase [Rhodococcus sp. BP-324]MBY6425182.1 galactan 5-O-arabinofuranosyltransferase [Rhodococcus sp. BP-323]MBY6430755.1 galactan 5-O-arabinofuranosyltransferase [Rhodococc